MTTAVLYARYSSDKQREASIDDQLRVCNDYCAQNGIEVLRTYADYALSGKTDQRPEFRRMIANAPESDYVVVYMFDRFSRDRYDSATYKKMLRDLGVRVISVSEQIDDTPEGGLQEGLLELLSEYYIADLKRKVRRGMEGNALKAMDNGYRIFGYRTDKDTRRYVIDEAEADVVREIFARYVSGDSIGAIARDLASRGWTTSRGTPVNYNWVQRVLSRKAYTGVYAWDGIEVEDGMPRIIDDSEYAKARSRPKRALHISEPYLLSGKLICESCGKPMHGSGGTGRHGRRYRYYSCPDAGDCRRRVRCDAVEDAIADAILRITSDEQRMRSLARRIVDAYQDSDSATELSAVESRISALEAEQGNLTSAARKGLVTDGMVQRNREIEEQLLNLHNRRGILMSQDAALTEDDIVEFLGHGFDRSDEDFIFGSFLKEAYLGDGTILAVYSFRDEQGDLMEDRILIEKENLERFSFTTSGVPGDCSREPRVIALPCGFAIVIPIAS